MERGLLKLVLRGKDSAAAFSQAGAASFALEIEDLISLHITGDTVYGTVTSTCQGGGAFHAVPCAPGHLKSDLDWP